MDALLGYKGSHKRSLSRMKSVVQRWAALPSHARTEQMEFPKWKKDFIRQNRQFYADNKKWIDPWMGSVLQFPSSLQKLEWNVKGGTRDIWQYVLQFRASGVRVKRRTTAPSLIAMTETQVPIIAWERRYMTPKECARLQSLHTLKELPDTSGRSFQALGNAVNTSVVERVASALLGGPLASVAPPTWGEEVGAHPGYSGGRMPVGQESGVGAASIEIRPEVTMLSVLRHLNYKPWFAVAEFIDNALQSYAANAEALRRLHGDSYRLVVKVDIDAAGAGEIVVTGQCRRHLRARFPARVPRRPDS